MSYLALLQIVAFVLNILPVPGLDGFGVIEPYLSPQTREMAAKVRPWAPLALFALLFAAAPLRAALFGAAQFVFTAVGGSNGYAYLGQGAFMFWQH
jgi:Zn-dependent protease